MRAYQTLILSVTLLSAGLGCNDSSGKKTVAVKGSDDAGAADAGSHKHAAGSAGGAAGAAGGAGAAGHSDSDAATGTGAADYAQPENWLCRPGHNAACEQNLDTTIVKADGSLEVERFEPNANPPIDCFYVYPTVSLDATPNSDLVPGPEEESVVRAQFARFASQCRLFAPMYRQVTLTSLRASIAGMTTTTPDRNLGINDVRAAWRYYLEHENQGRAVVLVGHSQGSGVLTQLIKEELDKSPVDSRFLTALLLGTNVLVPHDKVVGGTFNNIPLCRSADQLGCVIVYASFRANTPPAETASFARSTDPNLEAACTNPAALGGGSSELHAYLSKSGPGTSSLPMPAWLSPEKPIDTPFVSVPGLISAECVFGRTGYYLAVTLHGDAADPRVDDIVGDVVTNGMVQADWGLHVIDAHLAMGNLVDVVHAKAAAYAAH